MLKASSTRNSIDLPCTHIIFLQCHLHGLFIILAFNRKGKEQITRGVNIRLLISLALSSSPSAIGKVSFAKYLTNEPASHPFSGEGRVVSLTGE